MTVPPIHFLVVDDIATVRRIIISLLDVLGYTKVSEAENGTHALELLRARNACADPINFVITDCNMPVMDGFGLLKAMRSSADLRELPVLMISSELGQQHIDAALESGADGYLSKLALSAELLDESCKSILAMRKNKA